MGQSIQEWAISKFCGRQPLKNLKGYGLLKQTIFLYFANISIALWFAEKNPKKTF